LSPAVSIIVPTYNERGNIGPLVARVGGALSGQSYELFFVDDDSQDGTGEAIRSLAGRFPVPLMVRQGKKGLASAVLDGVAATDSPLVIVMDADLQHPPEVLPGLLSAIESGADVVVASRYMPGGGVPGWSLFRRTASRVAGLIAHILLPRTRRVHDPMSGYFAFRREVITGINLSPTGFKILLEILVRGSYRKVVEVPYRFGTRQAGSSKLGLRQELEFLKHIYNLMGNAYNPVRFLRFALVGASGVMVNTVLLWLLTDIAGLYYLLSAAIATEAAIISNFIWNDIYTFADRRSKGTASFIGRLLRFNLVSLGGLAINLAVLWFFTSIVGVYYLMANLIGIAVAMLWNFLVNLRWTWRL